jgi:hypothetical protein
MTVGTVLCAVALVLFSRVGVNASYVPDVLPAAVILGLGLSLTVAPLTATALGSVDESHAGVASGANNAVARAAGLLAVAVLPLAAGLGTGSLSNPAALAPACRTAMLLCSAFSWSAPPSPSPPFPPNSQARTSPSHPAARGG